MELKDTTKLMNSANYKERFIAEYLQTKIRYEKLNNFLNKIEAARRVILDDYEINSKEDTLKDTIVEPTHDCPSSLLQEQLMAMKEYLHILEVRAIIEKIDLNESK